MASARGPVQEIASRLGRDHGRQIDRFFSDAHRHRPAPEQTPRQDRHFLARLVIWSSLGLLLVTATIVLAVRLFGAEIAKAGHSVDSGLRQVVIGNDVMDVPGNVIRFRTQRRSGNSDRLDLYFYWPEMAGYSDRLAEQFNSPEVNPAILFVNVEPRDMTQDMTGRVEPIYSKFLIGTESNEGHGLRRRALSASGGFAGEDLWYETGSPYPFTARCTRPGEQAATPYCLRDIHMGRDLSVTYRFHLSLISEWMALETAVRAEINAMLQD